MERLLDLPISYRLKTVGIGLRATALALAALAAYPFLGGHAGFHSAAYFTTLALAAAGAVVVWRLPWKRLFESGLGIRFMYAWSFLDILLITAVLGSAPGRELTLFGLYGLTTIFFALSYPRRGQIALMALTIACYLGLESLTGWRVSPAGSFVATSLLGILAFMASFIGRELARQTSLATEHLRESSRRADLLATIARSAHSIGTLDSGRVLTAVTDAVIALHFDAVSMCLFEETGDTYRVIESRGLPDEFLSGEHPNSTLIMRLVRERRTTAFVDDYASDERAVPILREAGFRSVIGTPVWSAGKLAGVLVAGCKGSRRLTAEDIEAFELLAIHASIALENARRFEDERRSVERLGELDNMKDDFLSTVSHELRTPLTAIEVAGLTLEQRWNELDEELRKQMLSRLNANARTLEDIITSLLDFSRMQAGHPYASIERMDLAHVVEAAAVRVAGLFADHALEVDVDGGLMVQGDPMLVDRVVENLLSNAAKHTPKGSRVRLTARRDAGFAVLSVHDDGPGIPADEVARLSDRFFRGRRASSQRTRGLGLGLALVREILGTHGTYLEIESAPGAGARFSFRLPLEPVPGMPRKHARSASRS